MVAYKWVTSCHKMQIFATNYTKVMKNKPYHGQGNT